MQEKRFGNGKMKIVEKVKRQNQLVSCLKRQRGKCRSAIRLRLLVSGFLGLGYEISRQRDWKKIIDGDVSHSSEFKLLTRGVEVVTKVVCTIVFLFL
jgi:hypothetical protein